MPILRHITASSFIFSSFRVLCSTNRSCLPSLTHCSTLEKNTKGNFSSSPSSSSEESKGRSLANRFMKLRTDETTPPAVPKLAATILVCLYSPSSSSNDPKVSDYKVLMVKRSLKARFMPGAHVFPGGILEESDTDADWAEYLSSTSPTLDRVSLSTRVAAVRELFEETNVLLHSPSSSSSPSSPSSPSSSSAFSRAITPDVQWRDLVRKDATKFKDVYRDSPLHLRPPLPSLLPFSRWITPKQEKFRYDTYFYLVPLLEESGSSSSSLPSSSSSSSSSLQAVQDNSETTQVEWFRPEEALLAFTQNRITLPPPTWITLTELTAHSRLSSLCSFIQKGRDMTPREPHIKVEEDRVIISFLGDAIHPQSHNPAPSDRFRCELVGSNQFQLINNLNTSTSSSTTSSFTSPSSASRL